MSTVAWITARGLFGRRRVLLLLPLPLLLVGLALLCRAYDVNPAEWGEPVLVGLGLAVVLPVIALIVGTGVLGSEIDDGTIVHILTKPLPRRDIILAKLRRGGRRSPRSPRRCRCSSPACWPTRCRFGAGPGRRARRSARCAYSALFLLLSLLTRRPVLLGLVYILVWEGLLGPLRQRHPGALDRAVRDHHRRQDRPDRHPAGQGVVTLVAIVMSAIFAVGCTLYAIDRLGSFSVAGETSCNPSTRHGLTALQRLSP